MAASEEGASLVAGDQTLWADASVFISKVCEELDAGELVHGENFSLFESMAALEIMDPKMDGGMDIGGPKSVDDAISLGMAPTSLSIAEIIDVMDHLLSCEATWHRGHSLAQTVFSSIYMLRMDRAYPMHILYSYCKITRATCSIVRAAVSQAHTHEEEDLFAIAFGIPVDQDDTDCLAVLDAAEGSCARQLRVAENKSLKKNIANDVQPLQENEALESGYCQSVLCRLRFRKAFYQALNFMDKPKGGGLSTARKHISTALSELSAIRDSCGFLSSQYSSENPKDSARTTASGRAVIGFNENINRSLLPPTPPRSMKLLPLSEALDYFERLLHDLDRVCAVSVHLELEAIMQLIVDFQKSQPDLVARARMQLLVLQENKLFGMRPLPDVIYSSVYQNEAVTRDEGLNKFLQQAGWLVANLLKVLCAHPAWQCRKLGKSLEDWSNLFQQVDLLGDPYASTKNAKEAPIVTWIACQASWIAKQYLMMGFDLELYSSDEHCMIYWYLDHVVLTLLHYKLEREQILAEGKKIDTVTSIEPAKTKSKKKKGAGKDSTKKKGAAKESPAKNLRSDPSLVFLQCISDLCKGYIWMLVALIRDGKINQRRTEFTTEQERYMQRFELLQRLLVPSPLPFYHFKEATKLHRYPVRELYQLSYERFMAVEQNLQALNQIRLQGLNQNVPDLSRGQAILEIRQLEQVVLRNRVALQIIDRSGPGDTLKVSFQFSQHPCFGVVVVKNA